MLTDELRMEIIYTISKVGGHLSSSLGVVELTVALHHVFNTPEDKVIWDVGHQVNLQNSTLFSSPDFISTTNSTYLQIYSV